MRSCGARFARPNAGGLAPCSARVHVWVPASNADLTIPVRRVGESVTTEVNPPRVQTQGGARDSQVRVDIQALRALAVVLVVVFHAWPHRLSGGYVGVDVFFVISGFLITGHLIAGAPRTVLDVARFWAKRVRRLIPAASLVIVATLVATWFFLPVTSRIPVAKEAIASAMYVENWYLFRQQTDYLAQGSQASPLQHFWSLSIEEQFYIVWPVLVAVAVVIALRFRISRMLAVGVVLGAVTLGSFLWSARVAIDDGSAGYFSTSVRAWELGLGGLLAWVVARGFAVRSVPLRLVLAWCGAAAIVAAALVFDGNTAFPGYVALLPTLGTLAVVAAAADGLNWSPHAFSRLKPVEWVGDASYSIYLWHWPVLVIAPVAVGSALAWPQKLVALAVVILLAGASRRWVEEPLRRWPALVGSTRNTFALLALFIASVVGAAWLGILHTQASARAATDTVQAASDARCTGAGAMRSPGCEVASMELNPVAAAEDKPQVYEDGCWTYRPFTDRVVCNYGTNNGVARVALYGNSHAGHWHPAILPTIERESWLLDTYLVSECYSAGVRVDFDDRDLTDNCEDYNEWARNEIVNGEYDLVVMSNRTFLPIVDVPTSDKDAVAQEGYGAVLRDILGAGAAVLVIRDTPAARVNIPECIAQHPDDWLNTCTSARKRALEPDPLAAAALALQDPRVVVLDATDLLCSDRCLPVVGGVITYFDHGHMTRTFAATLNPEVDAAMLSTMAARRAS